MEYLEQLEAGRYGSFELKKLVGKNLMRGLVISILIHSAVVASPYIARLFESDIPEPTRVIVIDPSTLTKLKSQQNTTEQVQIARPNIAPPKAAIPVAVPEEKVEEQQQLMPSQEELSNLMSSGANDSLDIGSGTEVVIKEESEEAIPGSDVFIPFEVAPQPLPDFSPHPEMPEMARIAKMTGKVIIQVYVDKKGEVKKYKIVKEEPKELGFGEAVEKVISKWKFTPAVQQGHPVGVWIAIPFNFKYKQ